MEEFRQFNETIEISNTGLIRRNGEIIPPRIHGGLYCFISNGREYSLPRAVLSLFNPVERMDKRKAQKINNIPENNHLDNLRWSFYLEKEEKKIKKIPISFKEDEVFLKSKELDNLYEISNYGNLRATTENPNNYIIFTSTKDRRNILLGNKSVTINIPKLVLKTFKPELVEKNSVYHKDGNKENNHIDNLDWCITGFKPNIGKVISEQDGECFIPTFLHDGHYEVSNLGRLRNSVTKESVYVKKKESGYQEINYRDQTVNKSVRMHRLVKMTFDPIEGMDKLHVNHKNGIRNDNRLENLEWSTPRENNYHKIQKESYTTTNIVGISKRTDREKYRVKMYLGQFDSFEEAKAILKKAYDLMGMSDKYIDRDESNALREIYE